jgi:hypothetical protein
MKAAVILAGLSVLGAVGTMFATLGSLLLANSLENPNPPEANAGENLRRKI